MLCQRVLVSCKQTRPLFKPYFRLISCSRSLKDSEKNIIKSAVPPVEIVRKPLVNFIWDESSALHASKIALEDGITGQAYTYEESYRKVKAFGSALKRQGFKKNDVMAIMLPNSIHYMICLTGATGIGMTVTTINPNYTGSEVARQFKMSKATSVLTNTSNLSVVKDAVDKLGLKDFKIMLEDDESKAGTIPLAKVFQDNGAEYPTEIPKDFDFENDIAVLPYSSGTTGLPKGVMCTHICLVSNICQSVYGKGLVMVKKATETYQPNTVCILPMFHMFALNVTCLPTLHAGGKIVTLPSFQSDTFVAAMQKHKPMFMHFAPPLVQFCVNNDAITQEHLGNLEYVNVAAAPVGEALASAFKAKAPNCFFREGWGMTETGPVVLMTPLGQERLSSCGVLNAMTEAKIEDLETGEALGPNQKGELVVRGPQMMKGYLDNEEATKNTLSPDGWLRSGDIAYYDEDHYFYIVDRLKELIKVKGFQVPPAELEDLLRGHPQVGDVAVIGIPHDRYGEVPRAYIIKGDENVSEEDIHNFVNKEVTDYKTLRGGIKFVDTIPKSAAGKILRRELRDLYKKEVEGKNV